MDEPPTGSVTDPGPDHYGCGFKIRLNQGKHGRTRKELCALNFRAFRVFRG